MNIISKKQVTTRKAHRCFSCAEMIGKGTIQQFLEKLKERKIMTP